MAVENRLPEPGTLVEDILKKYPPKVARKRSRALIIREPETGQEIQANIRTIPGIITQRGCAYAGCKGVVLGPTRDILNIVHGPVGCAFYSWLTRRNQTDPGPDGENFIPYALTTDMQDTNIVFGGEKKLKIAVEEAYELFQPKAIAIHATCPVGLIGDDIHSVAREMQEKLGIQVFGFSCEGYKGVSQSAGHHIANNGLFKNMVGIEDSPVEGEFRINLLGEYNIGGDGFELERILQSAGITTVATFSGNSTADEYRVSHQADLNLVMCHRSINYMAEMMETKFGIPWLKVNFIGANSTAKALRKIAGYFESEELSERVEDVIQTEMEEVSKVLNEVRPGCEGKKVMLFVGGSRAHHYQELFRELGMEIVAAGYEFAHRDDYEGRAVIPSIKIDADTRNIEELHVEKDSERFRIRKSPEDLERLKKEGVVTGDYEGLMPAMKKDSLIVDDISHYETEKMIEFYRPDLFCAGIKEKYVIQKMGVPLKQLHNYDSGGPYAGFRGAINFYREIHRLVNTKIWKKIEAPWELSEIEVRAVYGTDE